MPLCNGADRSATLLHCESRQTSSWSWLTKELTESAWEEIANEHETIHVRSLRPGGAMGAGQLVSVIYRLFPKGYHKIIASESMFVSLPPSGPGSVMTSAY